MTTSYKTSIIDRQGKLNEVELSVDMYKAAFDQGVSLPQYLNQKFDTDASKYGSPFQQLLSAANISLSYDKETGLPASKISDVNMAVVRPDGSQALTVSGRLLFPAVIMQMVESTLMDDNTAYEGIFNRMVALNTSVNSPRVDQPIVNLTAPRGSVAQPIAQMSEPNAMLTISLSERSFRIPTYGIGIEISDEGSKALAIDFVGITLREQIIGQRIANVNNGLNSLINGDTDWGISALSGENVTTYDSAITNAMTNKAWVKWLSKDWQKMTIDWVVCDIDTYLEIENRTGRPTVFTDQGNDIRLTSIPQAANPLLPGSVNFFIVPTSIIGAKTLVGIDSRKAINKLTYVGGQYSAVEQYVMRKSTAMRFDFAECYQRLMPDGSGWKKLVLNY